MFAHIVDEIASKAVGTLHDLEAMRPGLIEKVTAYHF